MYQPARPMNAYQETSTRPPGPDPYNIESLSETLQGMGYELFDAHQAPSTMQLASGLGVRRAVVLADHQTEGIGRWGRTWHDRAGMSVLMTIVEPFSDEQDDPPPDSLLPEQLFALAACTALQKVSANPDIKIKWPNDLVHAGKKLGGVLIQNPHYHPWRQYPKLFGVGINVHYEDIDAIPTTDYGASSIKQIKKQPVTRQQIVEAIAEKWSSYRVDLPILANNRTIYKFYSDLWDGNALLPGLRVKIVGPGNDSQETLVGTVLATHLGQGIFLQTDEGEHEFRSFYPHTRIEIIN